MTLLLFYRLKRRSPEPARQADENPSKELRFETRESGRPTGSGSHTFTFTMMYCGPPFHGANSLPSPINAHSLETVLVLTLKNLCFELQSFAFRLKRFI